MERIFRYCKEKCWTMFTPDRGASRSGVENFRRRPEMGRRRGKRRCSAGVDRARSIGEERAHAVLVLVEVAADDPDEIFRANELLSGVCFFFAFTSPASVSVGEGPASASGPASQRSYRSSIKSLNQGGRTRSTYAARKGTMGTMKNVMSTAIKPMAMSQICRSEMAGGGTVVDSAWGM